MSTNIALSPKEISNRLRVALFSDVVPFVVSSPGMGKSSIIRELAEEYGLELIDVRASQYEPTDFSGLPSKGDNGKAEYLPFDLIPIKGDEVPEGKNGFLLFLDEINHVRQPVVAALYKLILDRKVGNKDLHEKVRIVCAGNLDTDKAQTIRLGSAFNSRVMRLEMKADLDDWLDNFALKEGIDNRIISYLLQFKDDFYTFDPDSDHKSFCCARSWHMVDKIIKASHQVGKTSKNNDDLDIVMFDGLLSPGVASKFVGYCDVFGMIPPLVQVVSDPTGTPVPESNDACYATATSLASGTDRSNAKLVVDFIKRMPSMYQAIFTTLVTRRDLSLATNKAIVDLSKESLKSI